MPGGEREREPVAQDVGGHSAHHARSKCRGCRVLGDESRPEEGAGPGPRVTASRTKCQLMSAPRPGQGGDSRSGQGRSPPAFLSHMPGLAPAPSLRASQCPPASELSRARPGPHSLVRSPTQAALGPPTAPAQPEKAPQGRVRWEGETSPRVVPQLGVIFFLSSSENSFLFVFLIFF